MHCLNHGIKAGSGLGSFHSWGSAWDRNPTTCLKQIGNFLACKTGKSKIGCDIIQVLKSMYHKSVCMNHLFIISLFLFFLSFFFCLFAISWAALVAYGGSQARGLIGAVATGLQPTPQLMATLDP